MTKMSDFEKEVRKKLIDKDMSLSDLAKKMDISTSYLYEVLRDSWRGNNRKAEICSILDMDRDRFLK